MHTFAEPELKLFTGNNTNISSIVKTLRPVMGQKINVMPIKFKCIKFNNIQLKSTSCLTAIAPTLQFSAEPITVSLTTIKLAHHALYAHNLSNFLLLGRYSSVLFVLLAFPLERKRFGA